MIATPVPREKLLQVVQTLPAAPLVLAQLGQLLLDMNSGIDEITELLKRDASLTARIIRISNSVAYRRGLPNASIEDALARVGFTEVYRLTGFAAAAQLADKTLSFYGISGQQLRENSLLTALLMEALAESSGADARAAYTAGLLRSIGKVAIDRLAQQGAVPGGAFDPQGGRGLAEWEMSVAGFHNCDAAGAILFGWHFPAATVMAITDHYLLAPEEVVSPFTHMLNIAAGIADRCGHGLPGEAPYWELSDDKFASADLDESCIEDVTERTMKKFQTLRAAVA